MRRAILSVVVTSLVFLSGDLNEMGYAADVLQVLRPVVKTRPLMKDSYLPTRKLVPSQQWAATLDDDELLKHAQPLITNQRDWATLWKAWRKEPVPEIDFKKQFVIVLTMKGPHKFGPVWWIDGDSAFAGALPMLLEYERRPAFSYLLAVVERKGIRQVNGQKVKAADDSGEERSSNFIEIRNSKTMPAKIP